MVKLRDKTDGAIQPLQKPKKKLGRPSTGFDKKAYNREYMRKKRAAEKGKNNVD